MSNETSVLRAMAGASFGDHDAVDHEARNGDHEDALDHLLVDLQRSNLSYAIANGLVDRWNLGAIVGAAICGRRD